MVYNNYTLDLGKTTILSELQKWNVDPNRPQNIRLQINMFLAKQRISLSLFNGLQSNINNIRMILCRYKSWDIYFKCPIYANLSCFPLLWLSKFVLTILLLPIYHIFEYSLLYYKLVPAFSDHCMEPSPAVYDHFSIHGHPCF